MYSGHGIVLRRGEVPDSGVGVNRGVGVGVDSVCYSEVATVPIIHGITELHEIYPFRKLPGLAEIPDESPSGWAIREVLEER